MTTPVLECNNPWDTTCHCGNHSSPCWPRPDTSCCDRLEPANPTPEQTARIERMLHVAVNTLWRLSGRQFGACPVTVRPCRETCNRNAYQGFGYWSGAQWMPVLDGGTWFNQNCNRCRPQGCSCVELCEVNLPGPVSEIIEVKLDGEVLKPWMYRVDDHRQLVRTKQYVAVTGPTSLGTVQIGSGAQWCDPFPAPTATTDFDPPSGGCYTPQTTNPSFQWADAAVAEATYSAGSPNNATAAFYNGYYPSGTAYTFTGYPVGTVLNAGDVMTPDEAADGSLMKVTVIAGQGTRIGTPYSLDVVPGTRLRMERLGRGEGGCWPTCQHLNRDDTEDGTWSVTYRPGIPVPQDALWAAGLLACELLKACDNDAECKLPTNAQRIARQGVTVELAPVLVKSGDFLTGIGEVDLWLESVNPYKAKMPSAVFSLDLPAPRVRTFPCD